MRKIMFTAFLMIAFASTSAMSERVGDVDVPDTVTVDGVAQPLVLNGAGMRTKFFIDVYAAALYLPHAQTDAEALLESPPANRVLIHVVYSKVRKREMDAAWRDGFANNLDAHLQSAVAERLEAFIALFGDMRENDVVWLDYVPGRGTVVSINGAPRGIIDGADFNSALLAVWLGRDPISESLKNALVGVANG